MNKKLGFGCMRLPVSPADPSSIDLEQLVRMTDLFIEGGFRYFDVAATYCDGRCEDAIRQALVERHPREAYILADKLPTMEVADAGELESVFGGQLKRCGVEYFDRYIIHCATARFRERAEALGAFEFAEAKKREGRTKAIGFSFHDSPELLGRMLEEHPEIDFVQLQINYADWRRAPYRAMESYNTAVRHGKPVTVMCVLKGGVLAEVPSAAERIIKAVSGNPDPVAWALRFAASLEGTDYVLSGMSSIVDVNHNVRIFQNIERFSEEEFAAAEDVADAVCAATPVQCTSCGYCLKGCPKEIAINDLLHLYNAYSRMFGARDYGNDYSAFTDGRGRASECLRCRRCEGSCPQHIAISDWIGRVADVFEAAPATA